MILTLLVTSIPSTFPQFAFDLVHHPSLKEGYSADVSARMEFIWIDRPRRRLHLSEPLDTCEFGDYFGHGWAIFGILGPAPLHDVPEFIGETPGQRRMWWSVWSLLVFVLFIRSPIR